MMEGKMPHAKSAYEKRSVLDRRSPVSRPILDIVAKYPGNQDRGNFKERRSGWEERYGWERISIWSSSPKYSKLP
jgi:hypothetical protein